MTKTPASYNSSSDYFFVHDLDESCNIDVHLHDSYEVFQACSDNIRYFVEGSAYDLRQGDLIITNHKEIHRPTTINDSIYERKFIQFNPNAFISFFDSGYNPLSLFDNRPSGIGNHIPMNKENRHTLTPLLDQIAIYSNFNSPKDRLILKSLLLQLFLKIDEIYKKNNEVIGLAFEMDPRITSVKQYLDQNYHLPFSLEEISKKNYIDKYYLSHLFKKNTGFTLLEYIQSKRIQKAKQLIHQGISLTEISRLCGYNDYSNFYKSFKKLVKTSPKSYKNRSKLYEITMK